MKERMSVVVREERSLEQFMMGVLMHQATSYTSSLSLNRMRDQHRGNCSIYKIHGNKVNTVPCYCDCEILV